MIGATYVDQTATDARDWLVAAGGRPGFGPRHDLGYQRALRVGVGVHVRPVTGGEPAFERLVGGPVGGVVA